MVHGKVKEVIFDETSCRPVKVHFENGEHKGNGHSFACGVFRSDRGQYTPTIASDKIVYTAAIDREEDPSYNFLAIRNKKTRKVRLVALDTAMMKALPVKMRKVDLNRTTDTKNVSIQELQKTFGSKKSQRHTEQSERLKVNVEAVREQLEKTVADLAIEEDTHTASPQTSSYLPPINENATELGKVYVLKELIPSTVLKSLREEAEKVLDAEGKDSRLTDFIKKELEKLKSSAKENKLRDAQILLLMDCLIHLTTVNAKLIVQRSYSACEYSKIVSLFILDNFTLKTDKSRTRPLSMKQKTICYVLVLGMLVSGYVINLDDYAVALKMGLKKVQEVGRVLRFTFNKNAKDLAQLALPLPPVVVSSPSKRAKK